MEQGWRCDHKGAGVVCVMDSPKGAALGVVLGILKDGQPQSLTLHRDLFSLSFVEGRDGVADDFHALCFLSGWEGTVSGISCSQLHRKLFLLSRSQGCPYFLGRQTAK